ncbi:autotransporter outer membrane beta-barrel domain-containing protein [Pseudomonas schmalbachii]|uniref:Autotransporter outer membrane beta-barrel domain-containing protein n=1 Tax=Pseudomonas schmalbachii TaxID=2816993 RepID=A0ABS3TKR3_9PSED|nr:autotransporter outer membrane beta-barrel domain-containing protein [Pseudomonas schmalbachii]MBO3273763.1 autotransporter outer membrane beta-barrel domain-containing protein [Pseudomonas schmalbachii]
MKSLRHDWLLFPNLRRSRLAHAIGLLLAGLGGSFEVDADTDVATMGGSGIADDGTYSGQVIKLKAANTTGVLAGAGKNIRLDAWSIESGAVNAAQAKDQVGLHAENGGQIAASGSSVVLEPRTGAGAVVTASDMTGVLVESGGSVSLTDTDVLVGGNVKGNNNRGVVVTGDGSAFDMSGGSIGTTSWGAIGLSVENGGQATLSNGTSIATSGARSTATAGSHGLRVTGAGSSLTGDSISVTTTGTSAYGVRVDDGARVDLTDSSVATSNSYGHGVLADNGSVEITGGTITTTGKGSVGAWARNGASIVLKDGTTVQTSGAALSTASPLDNEKTLSLSHGLLATGGEIDANGISLLIGGASASAARAEDGGKITLTGSTVEVSSAATSTTTTAILHALANSQIVGSKLTMTTTGANIGGARAEGSGASVELSDSTVNVSGGGSIANPAAAARAMAGGSVAIDGSSLSATGLYGHGVSIEGIGSHGSISGSSISVGGNRAIGINVTGGATGEVSESSILVDQAPGAIGPWAPGALVDGTGSRLGLTGSHVHTTQKSSYGVQATNGASLGMSKGSVTTDGNYSAAITAANSTATVDNVSVTTHGNDNAMGILADTGATVTVTGGTVTTTGDGSPVASNLTFPHGLASRNAGALLTATGTSVTTTGKQAYGAAVDDGGSMVLNNLSIRTEGDYSRGLYAGIGEAKPGVVSLKANNITVETLGDQAAGAFTSRKYKDETANLDLVQSTIRTHGQQSHGLQSETGAALTATGSVVTTSGEGALGAFANDTASIGLDTVGIATSGASAHGIVARNGGSVSGQGVVSESSGAQSAALYVQGTDAAAGTVTLQDSVLHNQDGATIAVAGVGDVDLSRTIASGSGQWLNVDNTALSDAASVPDFGTGQWQGIGQSVAAVGRATVDLSNSVVVGSANTAAGSSSDVTMRDTSIWNLTGDSNLSTLRNQQSLIDFSTPAAGKYKQLRVGNYQGDNGTVALNTYLYTDDSPSDQLVIDGGTAGGNTNLQIKNAAGPGALTTGNGIKVVDAVNGGTTDAAAFRLLSRVKAGPYQYTLNRSSLDDSNPEAWYLRSTKVTGSTGGGDDPEPPTTPSTSAAPTAPGAQEPVSPLAMPVQVPNYRAETSLYSAIPAMALNYSRAMVDTLHERVGEERRLSTEPLPSEERETYGPSLGWGRVIYRKGDDSLPGGARYDYRVHAFQVGVDLYRHEDTDGSTDQAGLSFSSGKLSGSVDHEDGRNTGDDSLRATGIGGYWTHFGPDGWYLDGVLQFNRFDIEANPSEMPKLKTKGRGVTASLEAGRPFRIDDDEKDKDVYIEPQAQIIASKLKIDDARDEAADVRFEDVDSLTGRLGVRIDRDMFRTDDKGKTLRTNAWVRPSVWHEFRGKARTEFSSADGYIPFGTEMSGTWGELNAGIDYQVSERTTLTGSLGYQKAFGDDSRSYEGMLGVKVNF